jgi:hypothetical protein
MEPLKFFIGKPSAFIFELLSQDHMVHFPDKTNNTHQPGRNVLVVEEKKLGCLSLELRLCRIPTDPKN